MLQKLGQLVLSPDPPRERNRAVIVMKGRLKESHRVTEDGDVHGVRRQQLGYLPMVEAHVVADDVEALPRSVVLHPRALEGRRVEEVVAPVRKGEPQSVLLPEPEEDVEDGAAGCFVGFEEHDVDLWGAPVLPRSPARSKCGLILLGFGQTERTRGFLRAPAKKSNKNLQAAIFSLLFLPVRETRPPLR